MATGAALSVPWRADFVSQPTRSLEIDDSVIRRELGWRPPFTLPRRTGTAVARIPSMLAGLGAVSFVVAFVAVRVLLSRFGRFALDEPNARSLHERPVPRSGGIAVLLGAATAFAFGAGPFWLPAALALGLAAVSFVDDLHRLPTLGRLTVHLAAAALLVWYLLTPMHPVEIVVLVLAVTWITDLYNFMDGSDGLAGGMATIGFAVYALAAWLAGEAALAAFCVALSAASAAFLLHNLHPARIFLGDVGSIPLGFLAGALGLAGWRNDAWPLWFPVLVFGPFIADATVTLLRRLVRGEKVWKAHREHYYQRMVLMGFGHRRTAWLAYVAMGVCAAAAVLGRNQPPWLQGLAFFGASVVLGAFALWVDLRWARFARSSGQAA
jgi:UDP-GlcNAc:undecaprenyl-phosphate GlcNAc-1-phosphate transferase